MPTIDHAHITAFRAFYLSHEPQRHALMNRLDDVDKYTTIHRPIRDQHITAHLRGFLTLAAPMIGPDGLAHAVALDIDSGGLPAVQRVLDAAQGLGWTAYGITSTNDEHDGGHLWIHLDTPAAPDRARRLAQQIAETAEIHAELYPSRKQLRLPLGVHRWTGNRGMLLVQDGTTLDLDSGDQAITQALELITSLPRNSAERLPEVAIQPEPPRSFHTLPTTRQNAPGSAKEAIAAYNQATDLIGLLESYGGRIAERRSGGGVLMHCPCGHHSHGDRRPSLEIRPALSSRYGRYVAHGYSTSCQFYTERGQVFGPFDVLCKLHGLTPVEALKRINPCRPSQPAQRQPEREPEPEPDWREPTLEERAETAEQRRTRIAEAHATHAEIRARMDADHQLSAKARAVMEIMLDWAVQRSWCRLSTKRIAEDFLHASERTVQRGMRELEQRGYIESDAHTTRDGRTYQGGYSTTIRRFLRVTTEAMTCHPCLKLESDLNPKEPKACERPPDSAQPWTTSPQAEAIAFEGGASYNPAEDWTLRPDTRRQRKPWRANISPKEFYIRYRAARERMSCTPAQTLPKHTEGAHAPEQIRLDVDQADTQPTPSAEAQAQLAHLEARIWRQPPTDPKKRRTYYALQRKAAQVERSNPRQAHALKMQARALEEISELLIAATSCTTEELRQAADDQADECRQVVVAPVTGRTSSEPPTPRSPLPGVRRRPRLVNVTGTQPSSTSVVAEAAPHATGGRSHAQTSAGLGEVDEVWLSAKMRQIAALEQQGQQERAGFLRRVLRL